MPCRVDYPEEMSARDRELRRVASLLVYVMEQQGAAPATTMAVRRAAAGETSTDYGPALCERLRLLSAADLDRIVYNAHHRTARDLANWWEEHQEADLRRERAERAEAERLRLAREAWDMLTPDQREALGLMLRP